MEKKEEKSETGCCPRFDPDPWDEKEVIFENKLFLKDRVRSFFHIPLNFKQVMIRNMDKIKSVQALDEPQVILSDENSLWGADIYIAVTKDIPGAETTILSGTFLAKVFDGPYSQIRNWIGQMKKFIESQNKDMKKLYFYYTTCPECAKFYGKNYVVLLAEI